MTNEPEELDEVSPAELHVIKRRAWLILSAVGFFLYQESGPPPGWALLIWLVFGAMYLENVVTALSRPERSSTADG